MTEPTYTCAACGRDMDRLDVLASAGPDGAHWFCRDGLDCREARAAR